MTMTLNTTRLLDLACQIQQIAAPTFAEGQRAAFVRDQFTALGLGDVEIDDVGNVYGRLPGRHNRRPLVITAHTDTVFPAGTPLTLHRAAERIAGPGIGDNSLGVASLCALAWELGSGALPGDVVLVANVGEEGLGDLCGIRRVVERLEEQARAFIVVEGMALGHVYHAGIGVRRYRVSAEAEGGHSWLHFGQPSAIHCLVRVAARVAAWEVPASPKTTYNIGTIAGGTSINTIAGQASFDLDLRSEDPAEVAALAVRVEALAQQPQLAGARLALKVIGDRPAGRLPPQHPLVQLAVRAHSAAGVPTVSLEAGSTDANLPLSRGLPCVCVGLTRGANSHRPDEYIETRDVGRGLDMLLRLVRGVFDLQE
jgi:acetylornithine deacetylase/succinyl-diaminopimelate desuccinylase-like protein